MGRGARKKRSFAIYCASKLRYEVFSSDLRKKVSKLDLPVYFFSGKYDYTVNHDQSKDYLIQLQAPGKGFYTFEISAHSPFFEEPVKVRKVFLEDVLPGTFRLADTR